MSETQNHITKVHICNYKSILDTTIDFKPGLNIIVGKNGSGKTNLLEGVHLFLGGNASAIDSWPSLKGSLKLACKSSAHPEQFDQIRINEEKRPTSDNWEGEEFDFWEVENRRTFLLTGDSTYLGDLKVDYHEALLSNYLKSSFTRFFSSWDSPLLDDAEISWHIFPGYAQYSVQVEFGSSSHSLHWLVENVWRKLQRLSSKSGNLQAEEIEDIILSDMMRFINRILPDVARYTPIVDIEPVSGQIDKGNLENSWIAKGFRFRFKVHNHFIPFSQLSDGTKRILKIVIEASQFKFIPSIEQDHPFRLLMIEEPELGIHPHQLHLLLLFLKEKSESMQIILTTHSPQVLDILDSNELDRIIISDFDPKKGSKFRHLNEKEIEKAQAYMKDMQLSDYWRFSDLEPR